MGAPEYILFSIILAGGVWHYTRRRSKLKTAHHEDNQNRGVITRAGAVIIVMMLLTFIATAYYHYNTNATRDYLCSGNTYPKCVPISLREQFEMMHMPGSKKYRSIYMDRLFIEGASMHISEAYVQTKYPNISDDLSINYFDAKSSDQRKAVDKMLKQQRDEYHHELLSMESEIHKNYEQLYIDEALMFALKCGILFPLFLVLLLCIIFSIKNYIMQGRVHASN